MNILLMVLALAGDPATCPMHAQHVQAAGHQHDGVDERGDHVMGFSHEKTRHSFRLLEDGGAIEVRANESADADSISAIRGHLREIAKEFAAGEFEKPLAIHGRVPDGVATMKSLGGAISYQYEELERGGRVRIVTKDPRGRDAVHDFLRFQIEDHRTGDSGKVE